MSKTNVSRKQSTVQAWIIWSLSAFFMFYKYAIEVSPSVMTDTLMGAFKINATQLGNLAASYFYAYLLLQIPVGLLLDKFGPRKVTTIAITVCGLGGVVFARAETLFVAEIGRFLTGVGAAFAVVNCFKLIANWFPPKKFAFMAGLMMTVAMVGAVFGQAPLAAFIRFAGWREAMEVIAIIGLVLAAVFWVVVRDKDPHHKTEKQLVDAKMPILKSVKEVLKHKQSWWLSIYSGFAFAPVMVFGGLWGVSFTQDAFGLSQNIAAQAVSMIFIGFAVGAPVFGLFSDWIGRRVVVMFWGTIMSLITISAVIYAPGVSHLFVTALLFLFGFSISSFLLCFTMMREVNLAVLAATAIGFMNAFDAFFGIFSDPLAGKLLDMNWDGKMVDGARIFSIHDYRIAFITIPIYLIIAIISLYWIKETYCKQSVPTSLP